MLTWAKTAPPPIKTEFVPIVNAFDGRDKLIRSVKASIFYYAGVLTARTPDQFAAFVAEAYSQRQDRGLPLDTKSLWEVCIAKAGIDRNAYAKNIAKISESNVQYALDKFLAYKVTESPSVGVAGQYVFSPAQTNGDPEMFFNILNGLSTQLILA